MKRFGSLVIALSVAAWVAVMAIWIGQDPGLSQTAYETFSTYNASPGGLSQIFGYLTALRGPTAVRRLTSAADLAAVPTSATLLRVGSPVTPATITDVAADERSRRRHKGGRAAERPVRRVEKLFDDAEERWVRAGGRIVIAPTESADDISLTTMPCQSYRTVFPLGRPLPSPAVPLCRGLSGAGLRRFHSLLLNGSVPVLVRTRIGSGELFIVSIPELFSNEFIGDRANLEIVERLAGAGRPVWFDETVHGIDTDRSLAGLLIADWRLGPALAALALAGLAAFWRRARRIGAADRVAADTRSEAVDLVDSLGRLYDRALDREECLRRYFQAIVRASHARTALTGEPLDRYVRTRTAGYDPAPRFHDISRDEFHRLLHILNRAYEMVTHANTR